MKRSKHSLSHYVLSTFNLGNLVPVGWYEVLPGDSVRHTSSMLLRCSPLVTPVMHPVHVKLHHWFVPYRIIWPRVSESEGGFEEFITGGSDGEGDGSSMPIIALDDVSNSDLANYLGIPAADYASNGGALQVNALPFRAYNKIYNEFYRDQDLEAPVDVDTNESMLQAAWDKDAFTAARPWTQKGPEVTLPLGTTAPVNRVSAAIGSGPQFEDSSGTDLGPLNAAPAGSNVSTSNVATTGGFMNWRDGLTNLQADLSAAGSVDINTVRLAFALQRYQEARAQFGSRYTEYLRYLGVRSSDGRLQRPEYLGGGRATISFSEVLATGGDNDGVAAPVGDLAGHGISAMRTRPFVRFFEEHGIVITLATVRPRAIYQDGADRAWFRRTKEDFFQKELESIGQQEVFNREILAAQAGRDGVFGYQDRYYEYRHHQSYVTGDFRSLYADWHFARQFSMAPALNSNFIACNPGTRPFADQTVGAQLLLSMVNHSIQARRMVGNRTIGRVL